MKIITKPLFLLEVEIEVLVSHIFRGSHLIGGYSTILDYRPLKLLAAWNRGYSLTSI